MFWTDFSGERRGRGGHSEGILWVKFNLKGCFNTLPSFFFFFLIIQGRGRGFGGGKWQFRYSAWFLFIYLLIYSFVCMSHIFLGYRGRNEEIFTQGCRVGVNVILQACHWCDVWLFFFCCFFCQPIQKIQGSRTHQTRILASVSWKGVIY